MEKKWRIFKSVIIIQFAISFLCLAVNLYGIYNLLKRSNYGKPITFYHPAIIVSYILISLLLFGSFCLFMIYKKYPAGEFSNTNNIIFTLTYFLEIAACIALIFITYIGATETFRNSLSKANSADILLLVIVLWLTIAGIYSLIRAIQFRKFVKKNSVVINTQLIEEIAS